MDKQIENIKQEKKVDNSKQGASKSEGEEADSIVIRIPQQFVALKEAAETGTPYCKVIEENIDEPE